jgi:hypothetical protein
VVANYFVAAGVAALPAKGFKLAFGDGVPFASTTFVDLTTITATTKATKAINATFAHLFEKNINFVFL